MCQNNMDIYRLNSSLRRN